MALLLCWVTFLTWYKFSEDIDRIYSLLFTLYISKHFQINEWEKCNFWEFEHDAYSSFISIEISLNYFLQNLSLRHNDRAPEKQLKRDLSLVHTPIVHSSSFRARNQEVQPDFSHGRQELNVLEPMSVAFTEQQCLWKHSLETGMGGEPELDPKHSAIECSYSNRGFIHCATIPLLITTFVLLDVVCWASEIQKLSMTKENTLKVQISIKAL